MKPGLDLLALHTTDAAGSIALAIGEKVVSAAFAAAGKHAPVLLTAVLRLLEHERIGLEGLDGVAVTTGPGSFTGIRIGLATAQGLAAARRWRVWACDSLSATAAVHSGLQQPLAVVLDARRGEVYAGLYDVGAAVPRPLQEPRCESPAAAARSLAAAARGAGRGHRLALAGSGAALVVAADPDLGEVLDEDPAVPVAAALARLARAGGCAALEPQALEPTYLRKSDAEQRRADLLRPGA